MGRRVRARPTHPSSADWQLRDCRMGPLWWAIAAANGSSKGAYNNAVCYLCLAEGDAKRHLEPERVLGESQGEGQRYGTSFPSVEEVSLDQFVAIRTDQESGGSTGQQSHVGPPLLCAASFTDVDPAICPSSPQLS